MPSKIWKKFERSLALLRFHAPALCPSPGVGLVWLLGLGAWSANTLPAGEPPVVRPAQGPAYRADRILIIPRPDRRPALIPFHTRQHVRVLRRFPEMGDIHVLELPPGADAQEF